MLSDRDRVYLTHIEQASRKIFRITQGLTVETFIEHDLIPDVVIRQLEVIGEASTKVTEGFSSNHPDWPWREMRTMRNFLIQGYHHMDLQLVWDTAQRSIPELLRLLASELGELTGG